MSPPPEPEIPHDQPDPDDLVPREGRVHLTARQRRADALTLGSLLLHLPHVAMSASVVFLVSYVVDALLGLPWWTLFGAWTLSGAFVFHRPSERVLARHLFGLRHPTPQERRRFEPVWREVTARAGVDGDAYQLWVEDSDGVNAMAAAGHIVGVTSHSLNTLPSAQLGGVLAHELGHHTRGHAWASLLSYWYALPGRLTWRGLLRLASFVDRLSFGARAVVVALTGAAVLAVAITTYGLVLLPLVTPYLVAAVARRSELRADQHAAALGFAPQLMTVLRKEQAGQDTERAKAAALGAPRGTPGLIGRLLSSHPDLHTRLHHLQEGLHAGR
ncbi:M48 family metalloprotease [Streptomyces sp. NPDC050439]|uniref:M48 family metalloprotease n=1 Tax=unclassified Streptomyces TaxID=2593676 RepID=UPI00341ADFA2